MHNLIVVNNYIAGLIAHNDTLHDIGKRRLKLVGALLHPQLELMVDIVKLARLHLEQVLGCNACAPFALRTLSQPGNSLATLFIRHRRHCKTACCASSSMM